MTGGALMALTLSRDEKTRARLMADRLDVLRRIQWLTSPPSEPEAIEDDGIAVTASELGGSLLDMFQTQLDRIDNALSRVDAGAYGTCARCGSDIPERRLEVL